MRYLKLFENFDIDIEDLMTDILDKPGKYKILDKKYVDVIEIDIVKKSITSENRNRDITGYFRKGNNYEIVSNKIGYIYDRMYKSKDTIEVIDDVIDFCSKVVNFTEYEYCYFKLSGMKIRIYLGSELFRRYLSRDIEWDDDYIRRNWGL